MNARLENWAIVSTADPYHAPELHGARLSGQVYGHRMFPDGASIITSAVQRVTPEFVETASGSRYKLGAIDPNYEKDVPDARERPFGK